MTHYNAIARNFDVEYFDKLGLPAERHVNLSRLAALEDVSKRVKMFNYKPAPESVVSTSNWRYSRNKEVLTIDSVEQLHGLKIPQRQR